MASNISSALLLLCILPIVLHYSRGALAANEDIKPILTARLRDLSRQQRDAPTVPCCLVSTCAAIPINLENHEAYKCYKTEVCGNACNKEHARRVSSSYSPRTPGYQIKSHYFKAKCDLQQCVNYRFDCGRCPDPSKATFSVYALRGDCIRCYY